MRLLYWNRQELTKDDVDLLLKEYEREYGVPSARRHEPFTDSATGRLSETDDWRHWDSLYALWRRSFAPIVAH